MRNRNFRVWQRCVSFAALVVALGCMLLAPVSASAHFVRPFVRQFTGTPTGVERSLVPFEGPRGVAVDGGNDLWVNDGGYSKGSVEAFSEFGPSGAYVGSLPPIRSYGEDGVETSLAIATSPLDPFAGDFYSASEHAVAIRSKSGVVDKVLNTEELGLYEAVDVAVDNSTEPLGDPSASDFYVVGASGQLEPGTDEYRHLTISKFNAVGEPEDFEGSGSRTVEEIENEIERVQCKGCFAIAGNKAIFSVVYGGGVARGGLAVSATDGDIYVGAGQVVLELNRGGEQIGEVVGEEAPAIGDGQKAFLSDVNDLAVDPTNGDLLVSLTATKTVNKVAIPEGAVDEFNSGGVFLGQITEAAGKLLSGAEGLAFDSNGDLYVVNHAYGDGFLGGDGVIEGQHVVDEFGAGHFDAAVRPVGATERKQTGAVLNGAVDPESELNIERVGSNELVGVVDCHFEYVSEAGFKANDVDEVQSVALAGASGGSFSLGLEGESTAAEGSGDVVGPASAKGDLIEGSNEITGLSSVVGEFVAGEAIVGGGIPKGTTIVLVQPGGIVLSADATVSGSGVEVSAVSDEVTDVETSSGVFAVGEEVVGAGIPVGTTIVKAALGRLVLSADVTASGSPKLSAALAYDASAEQVESALGSLSSVGVGNVAVSGVAGGPYSVEFTGAPADTAVALLSADSSGLTGGGSVSTSLVSEGGDGWGAAKSVGCEDPGAGEIPKRDVETAVHGQIRESLEAGASYRYRLSAKLGGLKGGTAYSAVAAFAVPHAPRVSATAVGGVTSTFATFSGEVNPLGGDTSYQFEYLPEAQFVAGGESWAGAMVAPAAPAGVGSGGEAGELSEGVSQQVGGLLPETAYRVRLVASNEAGVSEGEAGVGGVEVAHVFTTQPAVTTMLPDGRAYELVTPPNKQGAEDLFGENLLNEPLAGSLDRGDSSESGDEFLLSTHFSAFGSFPASGGNVYVFSRHPAAGDPEREEWGYTSLTSAALGLQNLGETVAAIEPRDFSTVALLDRVSSSESEVGSPFFSLLGPPGGPYRTLHADQPIHFGGEDIASAERTEVVGGSRDLGVVVLQSDNPELVEGTLCAHDFCSQPPIPYLYEWKDGELSRLDVKSDGSLIGACGAELGGRRLVGEESEDGAVSADGSKAFFTAPDPSPQGEKELVGVKGCPTKSGENPPELYMRSGEETVEVSAPEEGAPEKKAGHAASFVSASEDGSRVFFTSEGELTADDAGIHDLELYEYDTETRALTRISAGDSGAAPGAVVRSGLRRRGIGTEAAGDIVASSDGSHVYFVAEAVLAPANAEGQAPKAGQDNFYVYDAQTGRTAFIASGNGGVGIVAPEVTTDGRFMVFYGAHGLERYDAETESLVCVSCSSGASAGELIPPSVVEASSPPPEDVEGLFVLPPHTISEDGSEVFFDTTASLVPQDTNGVLDVYEWHEGTVSLLSTGEDHLPSYFLGASPSGANVFFGTHSRLVPADSSEGGNVYDARVCEPERGNPCIAPAPAQEGLCEGDACSHPPAAPNDATPGSLTFAGAGNITPTPQVKSTAKSCSKGKKLTAGRCVKEKSKHSKTKPKEKTTKKKTKPNGRKATARKTGARRAGVGGVKFEGKGGRS
jgi:hypothetical protein